MPLDMKHVCMSWILSDDTYLFCMKMKNVAKRAARGVGVNPIPKEVVFFQNPVECKMLYFICIFVFLTLFVLYHFDSIVNYENKGEINTSSLGGGHWLWDINVFL